MSNASDNVIKMERIKGKKYFVAKSLKPNLASQGKTRSEAIKNIKDAIRLYFEENPV